MSYNTFGRFRYTMKDSTRRGLANRANVAQTVRLAKEAKPELFCSKPGCLWRTGGGDCPKHKSSVQADIDRARDEGLDLYEVFG